MKKIIVYLPYEIKDQKNSGSSMRPQRMIRALKDIGHDVQLISGKGSSSRQKLKRVMVDVNKNRSNYIGVYIESCNLPLLFSDKKIRPSILFDLKVLISFKKAKLPISLFYRDVHWRYNLMQPKKLGSIVKKVTNLPLYQLDWIIYRKYVDKLFIPTLAMSDILPSKWPKKLLYDLPPGAEIREKENGVSNSKLRLLYVGGIKLPFYDLRGLFKAINKLNNVELTICCRKEEWELNQSMYGYIDYTKVKVVHKDGNDLDDLYKNADIFALLWASHPYLKHTLPYKLFETIGAGVPIITTAGTATTDFVNDNDIGWVVTGDNEIVDICNRLNSNRSELIETTKSIMSLRDCHTWDLRAKKIVSTLMST
ncbi:glycosyltransferase [Chitinispirillales bacterium ANBcel5]|uniref:glycosyltransferase n=1 Tax=Cellulosispirillum alkaliphilum TaxID=3039283 RepID=UPI002A55F4E0|nr:glycosyltransferase [Chitinispirillales bacterium ANBcel5]